MLRFIVVSVGLSLVSIATGCTEEKSGSDQVECTTDAQCDEPCSGVAAQSESEVVVFKCNPDLCACGIKTDDKCFATGGVIGKVEVDCPVDEAALDNAVENAAN